jgi:hypothetical protein
MGNATWVCFDCREAVRRPTHYPGAVSCPRCGLASRCVGTKIRIPGKRDDRRWNALRSYLSLQRRVALENREHIRVRRRHGLERRIAEIESRPVKEGRLRTLHELKERLACL